ncbi:TPA: hypothetical protein ACHJWX_005036, partial [Escherichia coli]
MRSIYLKEKDLAGSMQATDRFLCLTNILRSMLQTVSIAALELAKSETITDDLDISDAVERFKKPADGMPVDIIDKLTPHLRAHIDSRLFHGWYEREYDSGKTLSILLQEWVAFRNKKPAHGVLDRASMFEWTEKTDTLISLCLEVFSSIIPSIDDNELYIDIPSGKLRLDFPLMFGGEAIVISEVNQRQGNWKLKLQPLNYES